MSIKTFAWVLSVMFTCLPAIAHDLQDLPPVGNVVEAARSSAAAMPGVPAQPIPLDLQPDGPKAWVDVPLCTIHEEPARQRHGETGGRGAFDAYAVKQFRKWDRAIEFVPVGTDFQEAVQKAVLRGRKVIGVQAILKDKKGQFYTVWIGALQGTCWLALPR